MTKKKLEEKIDTLTNAELSNMDDNEKAKLEEEITNEPTEEDNANLEPDKLEETKTEDGKDEPEKEEKEPEEAKEKPVLEDKSEKEVHIQNRLLKKKLKEMQDEMEKAKTPKIEEKPDPEPNKEEDPEGWLAWDNRQLRKQITGLQEKTKTYDEFVGGMQKKDLHSRAVEEFTEIENAYKKLNPEYEQAAVHLLQSMYMGIKFANPLKPEKEVGEETRTKILELASFAAQNDMNPAEYLHKLSKDVYGFDPAKLKKAEDDEGKEPEKKGPNLKVVADIQKKSASPLGKGRSASAQNTKEAALGMTNAEWQALPDEEKVRLMSG